jgi:hypothetical protein
MTQIYKTASGDFVQMPEELTERELVIIEALGAVRVPEAKEVFPELYEASKE